MAQNLLRERERESSAMVMEVALAERARRVAGALQAADYGLKSLVFSDPVLAARWRALRAPPRWLQLLR